MGNKDKRPRFDSFTSSSMRWWEWLGVRFGGPVTQRAVAIRPFIQFIDRGAMADGLGTAMWLV